MRWHFSLSFLGLLVIFSACHYRSASELPGTSESVPYSDISLGGVLAEKLHGFIPLDSAGRENQSIAIEGIFNLQEQVAGMIRQQEAEASDSLLKQWKLVEKQVDLNLNELSESDLKKWVALNDSLLKYTGKVCFADALEVVFYNSQSADVVTGKALKSVCYTRRYDRIYVNIYNNSTLIFDHSTGGKVRVIQDTNYPNDGRVRLRVEMDDDRYMDLYVRIPEWSEISAVTSKGVKYPVYPGQFTEIAKKWKNGDEVEIVLGIKPELITNEIGQFAFKFGSLFLSYEEESGNGKKVGVGDPMQYLKFVSPPGKMPTFTFSGFPDHTLVLQPLYAETDAKTRTVWMQAE